MIARFGRFPHRDALLGRMSSAEELAFSNKLLMQRVLYEKVHVAVDDATSLAYVEVPAVERKPT